MKSNEDSSTIGASAASEHCYAIGGDVQEDDSASTDDKITHKCVWGCQSCEEWQYYRGECTLPSTSSGTSSGDGSRRGLMANPASTHCAQNGGIVDFSTDPQGNVYGTCTMCTKECGLTEAYNGECGNTRGRRLRGL